MRILVVLLNNIMGGPQIRTLSVAKGLRRYGMETVIITSREKGDFAYQAKNDGFKVYQIILDRPRYPKNLDSIFANFRWFFTFAFSVFEIINVIKKNNIDIVHFSGLLNLQAPIAALLMRKKIVWHLSSTLYPKILVRFLVLFIRLVSDRIIIIARRLEEYHFGKHNSLAKNILSIVYECVDISRFNPINISEDEKNALKVKLGISHHDLVIGGVANVTPVKGYEYFIRSASFIKKRLNGVKFVIVGDILGTHKGYYHRLQSLISSLQLEQSIIFTRKRDDIPRILSIFDIFVLSSVHEGGPIVTLEAMSMEIPVVATNVGAVPEQVVNGKTGFIVSSREPSELSKAVIALIEDSAMRLRMGKMGREIVEQRFSSRKIIEAHRRVYNSVYRGDSQSVLAKLTSRRI